MRAGRKMLLFDASVFLKKQGLAALFAVFIVMPYQSSRFLVVQLSASECVCVCSCVVVFLLSILLFTLRWVTRLCDCIHNTHAARLHTTYICTQHTRSPSNRRHGKLSSKLAITTVIV